MSRAGNFWRNIVKSFYPLIEMSPSKLRLCEILARNSFNAGFDECAKQLPEGMKHCTIVFKKCEKGHGRLVATNWIDDGCPVCRVDDLKDKVWDVSPGADPVVVTAKGVENCGSCRHWFADKRWCKRYPPAPKDNRHAWFPVTFWDDHCGEWRGRHGKD